MKRGAMKLEIHEDNSAHFRWTLTAADGRSLAGSTEAFASYRTALRAAEDVRDRAAAAAIDVI